MRAPRALLLAAAVACSVPGATPAAWTDRFRDESDGAFDISDHLLKYRGALPVEEVSGAALIAMMEAEPEVTESFGYAGEGDPSVLPQGGLDLKDHLAGIEIGLIRQALNSANGVVAHAAKLLRVQRTTLVEKLRKYGLSETVQAG